MSAPEDDEAFNSAHVTGLGRVMVEACVHAGALFDVYRVRQGERLFALKTPRPTADRSAPGLASASYLGIETSIWCGGSGFAPVLPGEELPALLLAVEAERIRRTGGAWNHRVECLGAWDGVYTLARHGELHGRFRPALVTDWHAGASLATVDPETRRQLVTRMLPALWDALARAPHGDLVAANLVVDPDAGRFALIDPGVLLSSPRSGHHFVDDLVYFTTTAEAYPFLTPFALGPGHATLAEQAGGWRTGPFAGGAALESADPLTWTPRATPSDPDLLATGILYYQALCGQHPFFDEAFLEPAWVGEFGEGTPTHEGLAAAKARLERPVLPPSALADDVSPAEDELALALLDLRVRDRETLVACVRRAMRE